MWYCGMFCIANVHGGGIVTSTEGCEAELLGGGGGMSNGSWFASASALVDEAVLLVC